MLSALFAFLARVLECCFLLRPIDNPLAQPLNHDETYAKPTEDLRDLLAKLIHDSARFFGRYRKFDPRLIGFTYLSCGAFGKVFVSPCGRFVIKVSIDNDDGGYGRYVRLALKRQDNPYYPKIFAHLRKGNRNVVLMERLTALPTMSGDMLCSKVYDLREETNRWPFAKASSSDDAHYVQLVTDLRWLLFRPFCRSDIATRNAMCRTTPEGNQLVITDPVV